MADITPAVARRLVLERFARLTPHAPAALDQVFGCAVRTDEGVTHLSAAFGKGRYAKTEFDPAALAWDEARFAAEIAAPLAQKLYDSKNVSGS